ncbi:hypothetical protein [Sphingomonas sanxanigenens]|uniref:Uncharacterized protein n=1 Tax=Sphingomonas sanxanigenens DSM 19645 = NX02 TaxID=1123269 RepID=W0ACA0_9SPHN|nr:hypothetical protein [Sphingomonas sanxanigenens]AHE54157.1 hypothetical protein NX02_12275 [Sphingomonas sanxanigenens DSM 19645 = NX02]
MKAVGFEFPVDSSDQWDGFNDPGIEHFTGNRLQHLGREVPQNTIDAKIGSPARITVSLRKVPVKSVPGISDLKGAVARCAEAAPGEDSEKATKFFADAAKLLDGKDIHVLQLRDANTTGLRGPCVNGKPFFALMKATGQSKKIGTSTGSYGIGKFAPFTVSELRTVFVSTVWADEQDQLHHYVQGKSVLMSHLDADGKTRRGTGFWGVRKQCQPVDSLTSDIPDWLSLADADGKLDGQQGTMLSIIGFTPTKGWQNVLTANIIENFFGAVSRGELEVNIEGGIVISAATLSGLLADPDVKASVSEQAGEPEKFDNVASYLRALEGGTEVHVEKSENYHLGECELRILVGENLPRRVAVLRNGMLITESLQGLIRFGDFKEFAAVLECPTEKGLELLRAMEPPRHDAFEPDRLPPDRRQQGRTALRELATWVRKMLARHAKDPVAEETSLDELAAFFGDEDDEGAAKQKDENPAGAIVIRARAVKPKLGGGTFGGSAASVDDEAGGAGDGSGDGDGDGPGEGGGSGGGENDAGGGDRPASDGGASQQRKTQSSGLPLGDVRAVPLTPNSRRVAFTPSESGALVIELQDSGADTNYALAVHAASQGAIKDGRIEGIVAKAGARCIIDVELAQDFQGTLRVVANAI